jgi:hypothetical protein
MVKNPIHNKVINPKTGKYTPKKRVYTIWVVESWSEKWMIYHCPDCRNPIAQYKGDLVAEVPGEAPTPYPVQIQCKNPNCGRKIVFKEAIEQVV